MQKHHQTALSLADRHFHSIAGLFPNLLPDILPKPNNMPRRFHSDQTAVIRLSVKRSMHLHPPRAKFLPDIIRKFHISPINIRHLPYDSRKRIHFTIHKHTRRPVSPENKSNIPSRSLTKPRFPFLFKCFYTLSPTRVNSTSPFPCKKVKLPYLIQPPWQKFRAGRVGSA